MKMLNALYNPLGFEKLEAAPPSSPQRLPFAQQVLHESVSIILRILAPISPHISHTLWSELGYPADIHSAPWPEVDQAALETDEIELVLQVNGKLRGHMRAPKSAGREQLERLALAHDAVTRFTNGQAVKKVVVVPGRLVNVVV